jgi:hypothetical protein
MHDIAPRIPILDSLPHRLNGRMLLPCNCGIKLAGMAVDREPKVVIEIAVDQIHRNHWHIVH